MKLVFLTLIFTLLCSLNLFAKSADVMSKLNVKCKNRELLLNQNIIIDGNVINLPENYLELKTINEIVYIKSDSVNDWISFGKIKKSTPIYCTTDTESKNLFVNFEINKSASVATKAQNCQVRSIKINNTFETLWFRKVVSIYNVENNNISLAFEKKYPSFYSCFIDPKFFKN